METKMKAKYEGELEEESGWTSYLQTDFCGASLFSESNCGSETRNAERGEDNCRLARIRTRNCDDDKQKALNIEEEEEGGGGNIREDADEDYSSESSNCNDSCVRASSSTLSDASSFSISRRSFKRFYPKLHQSSHPKLSKVYGHQCETISNNAAAANYYLEDTATSSPSSALMHAKDDSASSCSSTTPYKINAYGDERQDGFYEDGNDAVATRFKALEALIPRLKEVAGKGKEEEMVKVIERHVRDLELRVELLSSAWQFSRLKH